MRTRRRATIEDLRQAIDRLPRHTRIAMLEGIASDDIIVGAYSTGDGVCPMLAAHRHGGRTSVIAFAQAWDAVAFRGRTQPWERMAFRARKRERARRATERELLILRSHLEASLLDGDGPAPQLAAARRDHEALLAQRRGEPQTAPARPGDPDRAAELRPRPGWAWTRVVRRYDEYASLIERLDDARAESERSEPAPVG